MSGISQYFSPGVTQSSAVSVGNPVRAEWSEMAQLTYLVVGDSGQGFHSAPAGKAGVPSCLQKHAKTPRAKASGNLEAQAGKYMMSI